MRSRPHPIAVFLLLLIFGPYIAAALALIAVLWLAVLLVSLPFSLARRR